MRRAGIALAVMVAVGSVGGLAAVASAEGNSNNGDPGRFDNCTKYDQAHTYGWLNMPNESWHACD